MKKIIFLVLASCACFCYEKEEKLPLAQSYRYVGLDVPLYFIPGVCVGEKIKLSDTDSGDYSIGAHINPWLVQVYGSVKRDYYYKKNMYVGSGIFAGFVKYNAYDKVIFAFAPVICHGWEHGDSFSEINVYCPSFSTAGAVYKPNVTYKLGFKF